MGEGGREGGRERAFVLRLESFASFIRTHILMCVSFKDLLSIDKYSRFTTPQSESGPQFFKPCPHDTA